MKKRGKNDESHKNFDGEGSGSCDDLGDDIEGEI